MTVPIDALVNLPPLIQNIGEFITQYGLQGLALLPIAHISYITQANKQFIGTNIQGMMERVVKDKSKLPPGAMVIKEYADGEFLGEVHMTKNENEDWAAAVHTDEVTGYESTIGYMPYKGVLVPKTSNLSREQAAAKARRIFPSK